MISHTHFCLLPLCSLSPWQGFSMSHYFGVLCNACLVNVTISHATSSEVRGYIDKASNVTLQHALSANINYDLVYIHLGHSNIFNI